MTVPFFYAFLSACLLRFSAALLRFLLAALFVDRFFSFVWCGPVLASLFQLDLIAELYGEILRVAKPFSSAYSLYLRVMNCRCEYFLWDSHYREEGSPLLFLVFGFSLESASCIWRIDPWSQICICVPHLWSWWLGVGQIGLLNTPCSVFGATHNIVPLCGCRVVLSGLAHLARCNGVAHRSRHIFHIEIFFDRGYNLVGAEMKKKFVYFSQQCMTGVVWDGNFFLSLNHLSFFLLIFLRIDFRSPFRFFWSPGLCFVRFGSTSLTTLFRLRLDDLWWLRCALRLE